MSRSAEQGPKSDEGKDKNGRYKIVTRTEHGTVKKLVDMDLTVYTASDNRTPEERDRALQETLAAVRRVKPTKRVRGGGGRGRR